MQFKSIKKNEPILESIEILKDLNNKGKRKVPENALVHFISKCWKTHVIEKDGTINRRYYEMAILTEIRDRVKAGDISIDGSKQYKDFDGYLIPKSKWDKSDEYIAERLKSLNSRLDWVSKNLKYLDSVSIDNGKISLSRLEKDTPTEAKDLSISLYKIVPKISLTDLLLDVAQLTRFHNEFIHASTNKKPDKEDTVLIMAALLGMGTNIGLSKMADATSSVTYKQFI